MNNAVRRLSGAVLASAFAVAAGSAQAAGGAGFQLFGGDVQYNGFFRLETAINTSGDSQQANQFGDLANGVAIPRAAGNPFDGYKTTLAPGNLPPALLGITALAPTEGVSNMNAIGTTDTFTRYVPRRAPEINYHILRTELSGSINWGDWSFQSRLRAVYDPGSLGYRDFNAADYAGINGGFKGDNPTTSLLQEGKPNYFQYAVDGKKNPLFFERAGSNYGVDLPAFFLQWTNGNVTARIGNQSVAWGQLLFFRIMDTANGLDLRRHLILGRALEEYADQRESAPGLRVTWQATDTINVDTFAQQFIPTVVPNYNTPYNIIPSQFILHDRYWQDGDYRKLNYGIRVKQELGDYNWQAMYTRRYNQLGAIRWTQSNVNHALPNTNALGLAFNKYCEAALGSPLGQGCGPQLAKTAFQVEPAGVGSAEEWFNYAGYVKLDGVQGANKAIDDFPAAQQILAQDIGNDPVAAANELNAFFMASEGLHGHIERKYYQENVFGLGGGLVTEGEPGSLLDQLIINVEATYTPKRVFTSPDLRHDFATANEMQVGLVMEKYQRFFTSIPATYMVFQALHQKTSDLAGLMIKGYGGENYSSNNIVLNKYVPTSTNPRTAPGLRGGANYIVLAALQPTDAYIYEFSGALLVDVQGGVLFQPAVQWKPRGNITVNLFYNYVNDHAWGPNANRTLMGLLQANNEANIRIGYQF